MADSNEPTIPIAFWRGYVYRQQLTLENLWGDPALVRRYRSEEDSAETFEHPLTARQSAVAANGEASEADMLGGLQRQRLHQWLNQMPSPEVAAPLSLVYHDGAKRFVESIAVDQAVPPDGFRAAVVGHVMELSGEDHLVAETPAIRAGLHKINNELSIGSMLLEVLAIKLEENAAGDADAALLASADNARQAIKRAGETVLAIQRRLRS